MKNSIFIFLFVICYLLFVICFLFFGICQAQVTQEWVARYNGLGNAYDKATSVAVDGSGNVYVTGWSNASGTNYDYATIKYNSSGAEQWIQRYNGPGHNADDAYSIALDNSGNVYVTGASTGSGSGYDYATIKYSQMVGVSSLSNSLPDGYSLSQNYPNPFNPVTKIRYSIPSKIKRQM